MNKNTVKFNANDNPEFVSTLRKRVNQYFADNNLSKYANNAMRAKTVFMLLLYFIPLAFLLSGVVSSFAIAFPLYIVMGFGMAGIGLCVMHDANHGVYSKNNKINKALGFTANFLGAYHINWKIQHNVLHHSFTNIDEYDEDIDKKELLDFHHIKNAKVYLDSKHFMLRYYTAS